jgi:hypothetical protein
MTARVPDAGNFWRHFGPACHRASCTWCRAAATPPAQRRAQAQQRLLPCVICPHPRRQVLPHPKGQPTEMKGNHVDTGRHHTPEHGAANGAGLSVGLRTSNNRWPQREDDLFAVEMLRGVTLAQSIDDAHPSRGPWPMHTVATHTTRAVYSAAMPHPPGSIVLPHRRHGDSLVSCPQPVREFARQPSCSASPACAMPNQQT